MAREGHEFLPGQSTPLKDNRGTLNCRWTGDKKRSSILRDLRAFRCGRGAQVYAGKTNAREKGSSGPHFRWTALE